MSPYLFEPVVASVGIYGEDVRCPVRRIFCVGRNYAAHAREMGRDPDREPPFFFCKPADAVVDSGAIVPYPPETSDLHHEIELVVAIGARGSAVPVGRALDLVLGYAVGIDLTRRDLQLAAREAGRPWEWGKAFDRSAPCSAVQRAQTIGHPTHGRIWLSVNGTIKQDADVSQLIWGVSEIIATLSGSMGLEAGDLIFTGTPAGVGPLVRGDRVAGGVDGVGGIDVAIG